MNHERMMKATMLLLLMFSGLTFLAAKGSEDDGRSRLYGGYGHMHGSGHMGGYCGRYYDESERMTMDQAEEILEGVVREEFGRDFYIEEIMEFRDNFYAQIGRQGEETLALELIIDPYSGRVFPEHGPNMMWNNSYGHMRRRFRPGVEAQISAEEAVGIAQKYLDYHGTDLTADDHAAVFDGYYTLHTLKNGEIEGMLSVNAFTGDVWYHDWHGQYLGSAVAHEDEDDH